jgi:hypothetical protein
MFACPPAGVAGRCVPGLQEQAMPVKFVSRTARLLGFLVSPLLTAPAAAADLERVLLAAALLRDGRAAVHAAHPACRGAGNGRRRVER